MTAPRQRPGDLPGWPRLLTVAMAAAYCGVSPNAFESDVGRLWPPPVTGPRRKVWDRFALDKAIDQMPGAFEILAPPKTRAEIATETRDARRAAYEEEQRKRKAKIAKKWADAKWEEP